MTDEITTGSVTTPVGFKASGIRCGIKQKGKDLALIASDSPADAAALFTTNQIKAAPVTLSKRRIKNGKARAIVINSGNANACTGEQGMNDAREMSGIVANALALDPEEVLVASTGVIGEYMPMPTLRSGLPEVCRALSADGGVEAATAIMTTDTVPKHFATSFEIDGRTCSIGVIAKGSGMIQPRMATMICVFTTDVNIEPHLLQTALTEAVSVSLNSLTIDGEMSTNDCVFILANGAAGNDRIAARNQAYATFASALRRLSIAVTKALARDGEGATRLVTVTVRAAESNEQAQTAARAVANSLLVKTAIYGQDPNWGRVFSAVGATRANINPDAVSVKFAGITVAQNGRAIDYDQDKMKKALSEKEINIEIDLATGEHDWTIFTCDLTHEYITINAEYHT